MRLFKRKQIHTTIIYPPNIGISEELRKELEADTEKIFKPRFNVPHRRRQFGAIESMPLTAHHREDTKWLMDKPCRRWWQFWRKR